MWELAIRDRFGLPTRPTPEVKQLIKQADISALLAERRDIFKDEARYDEIAKPGRYKCVPLAPDEAEASFLHFAALLGLS